MRDSVRAILETMNIQQTPFQLQRPKLGRTVALVDEHDRRVATLNVALPAHNEMLASAPAMLAALKVVALTPGIYAHLAEHDPKALGQVIASLPRGSLSLVEELVLRDLAGTRLVRASA